MVPFLKLKEERETFRRGFSVSRTQAIDMAAAYFDSGRFFQALQQRVAIHTESQEPDSGPILRSYLSDTIAPQLGSLGFTWKITDNPIAGGGPFLIAERIEPDATFTVLTYGHADVVRGQEEQWRAGLEPWRIEIEGDRWYGRGTADNKGQHTINLAALAEVLALRNMHLGYNIKVIFETGEETGSAGLREVCSLYGRELAADLFIASDGPRVAAGTPTIFLGSRGEFKFSLRVNLRDGDHHSGNWGGALRNPAVRLAHAIASMVDAKGRVLVKGLLPDSLPANVREALRTVTVGGAPTDPAIDPDWGEPGLSPAERVYAWNTLEVVAFKAGNPEAPVNAIPGEAHAYCQIRWVVGSNSSNFIRHIREHLDARGFTDVDVELYGTPMTATRLDLDNPWVPWVVKSIQRTTAKTPALLPNFGGSLPNDVFLDVLRVPTIWIPHSYPACSQHAPDEHLLASVAREALQIMAGLFWDFAEDAQSTSVSA
jgi:acetylornithine deacetylase/succinyl-diaminopimelate desuccinylase-like protein